MSDTNSSVALSFKGVQKNLVGCILFAIVVGVLSMVASMACILSAFFLMTITLGALYLAYRDIFGPSVS